MRIDTKNRKEEGDSKVRFYLALLLFALFAGFFAAESAMAQQLMPGVTATPQANGSTNYTVSLQTLLFFTFLTFLPAIILMMTGFTRIVIVLSLLRMALGTQSSPPNQVIIGLSMFLTFFVMAPTLDKVYDDAYLPYSKDEITMQEAADKAMAPMKDFMLKQTREPDIALFLRLSETEVAKPEDLPLKVLVPAFVTSELKTAFQIGFMIFLPFLVIDLIVSSVLMSMGMMMLSPMLISLPFKLMLFVLIDGWTLLVASLIGSFS